MLKTLTLQEANGLLPLVKEHFSRIHILLAHLSKARSKSTQKLGRAFVFEMRCEFINVIKKVAKNKKERLNLAKISKIESLLEKEIKNLIRLGAIIKGLFPPHVDFLTLQNNEPVFLCWHGGESEISHCHHLDERAPMRQAIAKKSFFGPHMVH